MPSRNNGKHSAKKSAQRRRSSQSGLIWQIGDSVRRPVTALEMRLRDRLVSLGYPDINDSEMPETCARRLGAAVAAIREVSRKLTPGLDTQRFYQWRASRGLEFQRDVDAIHFFSSFYVFGAWFTEQIAALPSGSRLVELGAGVGGVLNLAASERPDLSFHGFDICAESITIAQRDAASLGLTNVSYAMADALDAPPPELTEGCDAVLMCRLLHELPSNTGIVGPGPLPSQSSAALRLLPPIEKWLKKESGCLLAIERFPMPHDAAAFALRVAAHQLGYRAGSLTLQHVHDQAGPEQLPGMVFDRSVTAASPSDVVGLFHHLLRPLSGFFEESPYFSFVQFSRCCRESGYDRLQHGDSHFGPARWARGRHSAGEWIFIETPSAEFPPQFVHFGHNCSDLANARLAEWTAHVGFRPAAVSASVD
jgi:hypothetical protein